MAGPSGWWCLVNFEVLGPFDVVVDGERRSLASPGEKAVLALLLLACGRVVPRESLVDALWGEELPANPANAVQGRISRLRRALEDIGVPGSVVAAQGPGYVAVVGADQVDAHRFSALVRAARAEGSAKEAHGCTPRRSRCGGVRRWPISPPSRGPSARRHGWRSCGWRRSRNASTSSSTPDGTADLVDELETLATANPLRERLHGQLMLALYRSGRQADALSAYRRLQSTLDEQLGLDPSEELRDLEQACCGRMPGYGRRRASCRAR